MSRNTRLPGNLKRKKIQFEDNLIKYQGGRSEACYLTLLFQAFFGHFFSRQDFMSVGLELQQPYPTENNKYLVLSCLHTINISVLHKANQLLLSASFMYTASQHCHICVPVVIRNTRNSRGKLNSITILLCHSIVQILTAGNWNKCQSITYRQNACSQGCLP